MSEMSLRPTVETARHLRYRNRGDGERGETLIEILVAVIILGTAVIAVIGSLIVAINMSDLHRKQATAGTVLRDSAEALDSTVESGGYTTCPLVSSYSTALATVAVPTGYSRTVDAVQVWDASNMTFTNVVASPCNDIGVQLVRLRVSANGSPVSETLDVVLRRPCRPTDSC
jgi:Tfp pilus assembly protein PilV